MPTVSEIAQFRRLVGDYNIEAIDDFDIESYLDDAARQVTSSEGTMVTVVDFDLLESSYKPEVVILAAINWWWNKAATLLDKHSTTVGQASQNVGEKYDRAMRMIEQLQTTYEQSAVLGKSITMGNLSRFSKTTLSRIGGKREESTFE